MAVGADNDRVADDVGLKPHLAAHEVLESDLAILGHAEADRRPLAGGDAGVGLIARQPAARARVLRGTPFGERALTIGIELSDRAEAVIRVRGVQELLCVRGIQVQPLGLPIRSPRTADVGAFVPVQAEPAEIAEDRRFRHVGRALDVGVLDAKDERAAVAAREEPIEQRRAGVADMQMPGRARRESNAHRRMPRRAPRSPRRGPRRRPPRSSCP